MLYTIYILITKQSISERTHTWYYTQVTVVSTQTQTQNIDWHVGKVSCQWPFTNIYIHRIWPATKQKF